MLRRITYERKQNVNDGDVNKRFDIRCSRRCALLSVATMSPAAEERGKSRETALDRDAADQQAAVADLVRVYQFRDRDRICCHGISVT